MVGWHHGLYGHKLEQTPGDNNGQGSLVCCSPWGRRVRHDLVTEQQQVNGLMCKVHLVKSIVFPVVMYGCEVWTIKKAEHQKIDGFELSCWRGLLRVP